MNNITNSNLSDPLLTETIDSPTNTLDIGLNTQIINIGGADSIVNIQGGSDIPISLNGAITGPTSSNIISDNIILDRNIATTAAIQDSKLGTISTANKVANSATTATSDNSPSTIVSRDAAGNFSGGIISGDFLGNLIGNSSGFTGELSGVVSGEQTSTTIGNGNITNAMLATIETAGLVSNSATKAT